MRAARGRGVAVVKYAQMLGALMARCDGIAISGTHGKSTTTAWLAYVLRQAGFDPNFVVGARGRATQRFRRRRRRPAFRRPKRANTIVPFSTSARGRAAILNIEEDHLDCYANIDAIAAAFTEFAARIPNDGLLVVNADRPALSACRLRRTLPRTSRRLRRRRRLACNRPLISSKAVTSSPSPTVQSRSAA